MPGLSATTELTPLDTTGARYGLLIDSHYERMSGGIRINNQGTERVGPQILTADGDLRNASEGPHNWVRPP